MNLVDALSESRCFRGVDKLQLKELMQEMELRHFQRNQQVIPAVDQSSRLAFVVAGRVKLVRHRSSGRDLILDILGPGRLIELAFIDDQDEDASVIALAQGTVATIDRQRFLARIRNNAQVATNLALDVARDRRALLARIDEFTAATVEGRLATLFCRMCDEEGEEEDEGVKLTLSLSRQDLADLVDTTIETAIRIMSRWNRDKLVLTLRDGFLIPDLDELQDHMDQ